MTEHSTCLSRRMRVGLSLVTALLVSGCGTLLEPGRTIVFPITAVDAPAAVNAGDTVMVRITVQSGGCREFQTVDTQRTPGRLTLTARGYDRSGPRVVCPADIRTDVRNIRLEPLLADPFTVAVRQPDGSETTRIIRVRP